MQSSYHRVSAVLSTRSLGKQYTNGKWGLRDASLSLEPGKMVAVLGPNGAGKSTLIHMVAGAIEPTEGEVTLSNPELRIGWSSQRTTIDWYLNTLQNVEIGGRLFGLGRRESRARAMALLERFQLADLAKNDVSMLSGGQQQRIQVARTLMSDPDIMLLDEPTAALDVESSEDVLGHIREQTRSGALALVSSHDLGLLEQYCDEVLFILDGEVVAHSSMSEFLRRFGTADTLSLVLDEAASPSVLSALSHYSPAIDPGHSHIVNLSLPDASALSDVVLALDGVSRVIDATRAPASLRNVYLQMTSHKEKS